MANTFGDQSTADEVPVSVNLAGKRILVTGVSAGLGVETARVLVAHGAQVVAAVRDLDKAASAIEGIRAQAANGGGIELTPLDLGSLTSVRACADALVAAGKPFDVVIANAGVMACPKGKTEDGFETHFGINHLGHFVLINRIVSLLKPGSRVVIVASDAHRDGDIDLDDLNAEGSEYEELSAYGRSKTANVLFAVEFDRRHKDGGVRATALHPGVVRTQLSRHFTAELVQKLMKAANTDAEGVAKSLKWKTIPQGAATSVWAAVIAPPELIGGRYCENCHVGEIVEAPIQAGVRSYALDPERAKVLWTKSEAMVGERF